LINWQRNWTETAVEHTQQNKCGDALDFWRVYIANKEESACYFMPEMKLTRGRLGWSLVIQRRYCCTKEQFF